MSAIGSYRDSGLFGLSKGNGFGEGKREEATVSFHYIIREKRARNKVPEEVPYTEAEFKVFCNRLLAQPDIDLSDDETCARIKVAVNSPFEKCEMVDDRTIFGRFRSLYSGHSYDNTDVGEIPDSSVSLRPFFFVAYLSESGRIYVGSQYLGQFGGYKGLYRTLQIFLPQEGAIVSHAVRHDGSAYKNARPQEIRVNFMRKPKELIGRPKFGQRGAMTLKPNSNKDEEFNTTVSTEVLARLGQSDAVLKKAVANMMASNEMLVLRDDDIEDCTVVATLDGKKHTINVIDAGHFATRFPLNIAEYNKGHPDKDRSKTAILRLLKDQVISRTESV